MTAIELLQVIAQITWLSLGVLQTIRAVRRPTRTNVDVALFFAALALITGVNRLVAWLDLPYEQQLTAGTRFIAMALPYLLLRIVHDFAGVPSWIRRAAEGGLAVAMVILLLFGTALVAGTLYLVAYFAALALYSAVRSVRLARATYGVTRQRMRAVAAASYFLALAVLVSGLGIIAPALVGITAGLTQIFALASALSYFAGFTPPNALRKFWQIPEFRAFVSRSAVMPRLTVGEIADEVAATAARVLGAQGTIGLYDEAAGVLRFRRPLGDLPDDIGPSGFLTWRVFASQQPEYVSDAATADPEHADGYRRAGVGPVLAAPITAGDRRLGVLSVYSSREPVFAEDDLAFVELVARQAAVLLEARLLIDDAARVHAVEEAARLKEDFISAAAHDLKTPLTTIVAQAQLLERRALREGRTQDLPGLQRLVREAAQLSRLVEELLDASRLERGALPVHREPADLTEVAREVVEQERSGRERLQLVASGAVEGVFDRERMRQLIENLVENALKYSPAGSPVTVRVWREAGTGRVSVVDRGIGIPAEDMPHVFERFRRGSNVDHRKFSGIGLGLYICRGIVEQHGGSVWAESTTGRGTTFHVALPLDVPAGRRAGTEAMVAS